MFPIDQLYNFQKIKVKTSWSNEINHYDNACLFFMQISCNKRKALGLYHEFTWSDLEIP